MIINYVVGYGDQQTVLRTTQYDALQPIPRKGETVIVKDWAARKEQSYEVRWIEYHLDVNLVKVQLQ